MPAFTETSPRGKSWTQTVTNHETMKFWWKSRTQTISTCQDVCDKVRDKFLAKSRTQIMKAGNVICVADFHDLCPNLSRTLSQSRRNGIWAITSLGAGADPSL